MNTQGTLQQVVTELGHLTIYKRTTLLHPFGDGKFYYKDKRVSGEFGPFEFINEAIEHWHENVIKFMAATKPVEYVLDGKLKDSTFINPKPSAPPHPVAPHGRELSPMESRKFTADKLDYDAGVAGIAVPQNVIAVDFIAKRRIK